MSFSAAFLEELRSRLPLSDIVGKRIKLVRSGREYKACCPFHNEKSPSFYVNDDKQFFHCFGCGAHGDIIGFVMRHDRLSFPEAIEALAAAAGLSIPNDTPMDREKFDQEKRLLQLMDKAAAWFEEQLFSSAGREALSYLQGRNLSDDAIRKFRLGFAPPDSQAIIKKLLSENYKIDELAAIGLIKKSEDRNEFYSFFRNRIIFPVGDHRGRVVAFGGRVLGEGEPKYLNSPDHILFHKGKLLYGLSRARTASAQCQPLIVVEGYMDVITLVEAGYSGALAPLGTALTEDQLSILWKLAPRPDARDPTHDYSPILCFDGDNAGLRAAARAVERALPLLTPTQTLRVATISGAKDPDDLIRHSGKSAMDMILKQAKPMVDFIWETTFSGRPMRTPEERGTFIAAIKQRVSLIANETLRQLYQDEIQKRISSVFNWRQEQPKQSQQNFKKTGTGGRGLNKDIWSPTDPILTRKQPKNPQRLRERVLLATMINYPSLFNDFGEDLARIDFSNSEYEQVRQQVLKILSESPDPLNAEELYRYLVNQKTPNSYQTLSEILSESTYLHAAYAKPGLSLTQAHAGWKSIWYKHLQELLQIDLHTASRRYAEDNSPESLARMMALRTQLELMTQQENEERPEAI